MDRSSPPVLPQFYSTLHGQTFGLPSSHVLNHHTLHGPSFGRTDCPVFGLQPQPSFSGRGLPHSYTFHLFADGPLTGDTRLQLPVFSSTPLRHPTFLLSLPFNQVRTTRQPNNLEILSRTADAPSEYRRQTAAATNPPADTDHHREKTRRRERAIDDQQLSASIN
ncbi:hypothetical protein BJV77DRAFT_998194 [Russula vinacea]|nr:hypothetical protein BJV77DRAFT_998194 [Russula vinacea]